jgi:hypothetical protein
MENYPVSPLQREEFPKAELNALIEAMRFVLESWAFLPSGHIGVPVDGPAKLPLERSVNLTGKTQAYLNIRTVPELGALISQYARGEEGGTEGAEDAFNEFVNIFCGHLVTYLWGREKSVFESYLPIPTTPADWPEVEPTASCAFITEDMPIEVRLWIKEEKAHS